MRQAFVSAPWHSLSSVAYALGVCGIAGVAYGVIVLRRARQQTGYKPVFEDWLWHTVLPAIAYLALLIAGLLLHGDPTLDHDGSFVVELDGRPAAFAWLVVDRGRRLAANEMTGTRPELRGRGLASTAKLATIRWAAENGISRIYTSNHEENAPMVAINRKLGYRVVAEIVDYERTGTTAPSRMRTSAP